MKFLLPLVAGLCLISCKPNSSGDSDDSNAGSKITPEEHAKLIKQKLDLERDLDLLIVEHSSDEGAEIEAAKDSLNEAYIQFRKVQAELPVLSPISKKIEEMQLRLRDARESGQSEQIELVNDEILKASEELNSLAGEQPEIKEAKIRIDDAIADLNQARRKLALEIPEARILLEALETLEKRLVEATQ
ncbi:MAG: hypothetical protein ACON38_06420 [Akkermansiaceae bacterium]